jgi:hypothetical protein
MDENDGLTACLREVEAALGKCIEGLVPMLAKKFNADADATHNVCQRALLNAYCRAMVGEVMSEQAMLQLRKHMTYMLQGAVASAGGLFREP